MRIIKFRGKKIDNGEWLYGYYFKYGDTHNIVPDRYSSKPFGYFYVHPETVGQFTGLNDKNGKEIYEGDICKLNFNYSNDKIGTVYFEYGCFFVDDKHPSGNLPLRSFRESKDNIIEIIGNIHDNPSLLTNK